MRRHSLIIVFLISFYPLFSQSVKLETLDSLLQDANYEEVLRLTDHNKSDSSFLSIRIYCKRAQALIRSGKLAESRILIDQLTAKAEKLTMEKYFAKALIDVNKGSLLLNEGRNDLALEALQAAIQAFEQSGNSNSLESAEAIATLGIIYNVTGKTQQAEEQLLKALSIRKELLPEMHELIAASYNDLGLVYTSIDPEKTLDYYDQALVVYKQLHDANHPKIAIANTNLGVIYRELKFYGDAVNSLETALTI